MLALPSCFLSFLLKVINILFPTVTHSKTMDSLLQPLGLGLLGREVSSWSNIHLKNRNTLLRNLGCTESKNTSSLLNMHRADSSPWDMNPAVVLQLHEADLELYPERVYPMCSVEQLRCTECLDAPFSISGMG